MVIRVRVGFGPGLALELGFRVGVEVEEKAHFEALAKILYKAL